MAPYNAILVGRYNEYLQKLFGIKGPAPAPQLSGDIQPSIGIFDGVENRYIQKWNRYGFGGSVGPVAAQANSVRIRNPASSGVLAVLEKFLFSSQAADTVGGGRILSAGVLPVIDLTVAQTGIKIDLRQGSGTQSNSALRVSRDTGTSPNTDTVFACNIPANGFVDFILEEQQEIVLAPGDVWQFDNTTVNIRVAVTLMWRERAIEEGETR